jgi:hypothetical protein
VETDQQTGLDLNVGESTEFVPTSIIDPNASLAAGYEKA